MKIARRGLLVLAALLLAAQFIRPAKNVSASSVGAGAPGAKAMPDSVRQVLQISCFDCHSNNTRYPWYANIEPVGWWLSGHIADGKRGLNFDEFTAYPPRRQYAKMNQIERQLAGDKMPLPSYLLIHRDAVLSGDQKNLIVSWTRAMRDSLKNQYPPDSLERRRGPSPPR